MTDGRRPTTDDRLATTVRPLLYYITDRTALAVDEGARRRRLLEKIAEAASAGVNWIQLREKDLSPRDLESLAREAVKVIQRLRTENRELRTCLLINSRTDIALAVGADGVHLRGNDISPSVVRTIWKSCAAHTAVRQTPLIGVSCHSPAEVTQAAANGASFAAFAPVFEKRDAPGTPPTGVEKLRQASLASTPVLALGGITRSNAHFCLEAGAAGIAAIRLFQENDITAVVRHLRTP
jgi:thiamine-phosphate pyrophosphorylase